MQSPHHGDIYQVLATIGNLLDLLIESVLQFTRTVHNQTFIESVHSGY